MSNHIKAIANKRKREMDRNEEIKLRKYLNADACLEKEIKKPAKLPIIYKRSALPLSVLITRK